MVVILCKEISLVSSEAGLKLTPQSSQNHIWTEKIPEKQYPSSGWSFSCSQQELKYTKE